MAFIKERNLPNLLDRFLTSIEGMIGAKMMPARLLLWSPKAFISSMILEALISHKEGKVSPRLLKIIRMQVSLKITCPFCIDMNSKAFQSYHITEDEILAMQGRKKLSEVGSFTNREKLVVSFCKGLTSTPIRHKPEIVEAMTKAFNEKEFAAIVTTIAQVDYWTRVIQGFGIQPAGFLETCDLDFLMDHN